MPDHREPFIVIGRCIFSADLIDSLPPDQVAELLALIAALSEGDLDGFTLVPVGPGGAVLN